MTSIAHDLIEAANTVGVLAVVWFLSRLVAQFDEVKTNHIPHLQQEIADLRQAFMDFLSNQAR